MFKQNNVQRYLYLLHYLFYEIAFDISYVNLSNLKGITKHPNFKWKIKTVFLNIISL